MAQPDAAHLGELHALLEAVSDGYVALGRDWRFKYVNAAAARIMGRAPSELLETLLWAEYPSLVGTPFEALYRRAMTGGGGGSLCEWYPDSQRWYEAVALPTAAGIAIAFRDVTAQRQHEARIEAETRSLQQLIDANPTGVHVIDETFRVRYANQAARTAMSSVDPLLGRDLRDVCRTIWPAAIAERLVGIFEHTMRTGEPFTESSPLGTRADIGREESYDWRIERITLPGGGPGIATYFYDLSERDRHAAMLRASEERLRGLQAELEASERMRTRAMRAAGLGAWEFEVETGRFKPDPSLNAVYGLPPDDRVSLVERWGDFMTPEDIERAVVTRDAAIRDRAPLVLEYGIRRRDGAERWMRVRGEPEFDAHGRVVRLSGITQDVTELRRVELEREREHALLDAVLESIPAGVNVADPSGRIVRWNAGNLALWKATPEQIAAMTSIEQYASCQGWRYPGGEPVRAEDWPIARSLRHGVRITGELIRIQPLDGSDQRVVLIVSAPILSASGALLGAVAVQTDVTAQLRAEEALEAANARLIEATRAAGLGIYAYYREPEHLEWDARTRELWGQAPDEPTTYARFLAGLHPEDVAATRAAVDRAFDPGSDGRYDAVYRVVRPDGTMRWIHATGQASLDSGRRARLLGAVQDITASRELTERLRAADRQKDVFLATLSHELRNPLAPIRSAAAILGDPRVGSGQLAWAQGVIQRQVKHMAWLLDDLLDVSRITQGKLSLRIERVDLNAIIDSAVEAARPLIEAKLHRLTVQLPNPAILVRADPVRLAQVVTNLITNAAKYSDPGGRIDLVARAEGRRLAIEVCDTGIGIPAEVLPSIFEMFSQVDGTHARTEGGLGVGLALVKGLVGLHGGSISAASPGPGRGSTFTVHLPLEAGNALDAQGGGEPAQKPHVNRKILIVDDNRDGADALGLALQLSGLEVRVAYDAPAALALAPAFLPDCAVLDIGMPGMDGYALAAALRKEPWAGALTLVALTGWGKDEDRQRALQGGFDLHLTKPVDPERLLRIVGAAGTARSDPGNSAQPHASPSPRIRSELR